MASSKGSSTGSSPDIYGYHSGRMLFTGNRLSRAEMIAELKIRMRGRSLRKCGAEWGVDYREIDAVIKQRQYPGARLLQVLGLREISDVMYIRIHTGEKGGQG